MSFKQQETEGAGLSWRPNMLTFRTLLYVVGLLVCIIQPALLVRQVLAHPAPPVDFTKGNSSENENANSPTDARRWTLPTGMNLIVAERSHSPLVAIVLRVRGGSGVETPAENGLAHFVEHLVFKGGGNRKPGDLDRAMEQLGGEISARTTREFTEFSVALPAENLAEALPLLAALVREPEFRPADLAQERTVIQAEQKAAQADAAKLGFQQINRVLYRADEPYSQPLMGTAENVSRFTADDLRRFWQRWYHPGNMVLVVTGGVRAGEVREAVEKLFPADEPFPPMPPRVRARAMVEGIMVAPPPAPEAQARRALTLFLVAFRVPTPAEPEERAVMETLMPILAYGKQGHLFDQLVDKEKRALAVTAEYLPGGQEDMVLISVLTTPERGKNLLGAIEGAIRRLREDLITPAEVETAKALVQNRARYRSETVDGLAQHLADLHFHAPALTESGYLKRIEQVKPEQVRESILQFLTPLRYAVAWVGPMLELSDAGAEAEQEARR
ncbi:MAG: pitrilysin family protein [Armatimonadaceae bacterium]